MRLFEGLENAFWYLDKGGVFERVIRQIRWDSVEWDNVEWVFKIKGLVFTTPSLDPKECLNQWSPSVRLEDGRLLFIFT